MILSRFSASFPQRIAMTALLATFAVSGISPALAASPDAVAAEKVAETAAEMVTPSASPALSPAKTGGPASFADLAEKLLPSVVNISTLQVVNVGNSVPMMSPFGEDSPFEQFRDLFENQQRNGQPPARKQRATSLGSGFVIDSAKGYIVTNHHVIKDAEKITVILHDDTHVDATLIGSDEKTDIALLKIDTKGRKLVAVPWGDSDTMRVGDWVLAIGNPYGLGGTITQGIISARARDIHSGPYDDYIQTDAAINRGNSGGPMFNLSGQVIGINTAIFSTTGGSMGIGFAVPSSIAKSVVNQLVEYGRTKRGWLGVKIQEVTPGIAESLKSFGEARGALVAGVSEESPATKAGVKTGDIILRFDGKDIKEMRELPRLVADTKVGHAAKVTLWRDGKTLDVTLTVGELELAEEKGLVGGAPSGEEDSTATEGETEAYGLNVAPITGAIRKDFNLSADTKGLIITDINPESPAIDLNLQVGDVILEADQQKVSTPEAFKAIAEAVKESGRKSLFLLVERQGEMTFVALPLEDALAKQGKSSADEGSNSSDEGSAVE